MHGREVNLLWTMNALVIGLLETCCAVFSFLFNPVNWIIRVECKVGQRMILTVGMLIGGVKVSQR